MATILIDSDVCMDFISGRTPWNVEANRIFLAAEDGRINAFISGLTFSNLFFILRKIHGSAKTVANLADMRKLSRISPISPTVIDWALAAGWTDFEDALQYQAAVESQCEAVVSRNPGDYKKAIQIPVLSPAEFISKYIEIEDDAEN
jgi:predicted nucleic acid-binding protein